MNKEQIANFESRLTTIENKFNKLISLLTEDVDVDDLAVPKTDSELIMIADGAEPDWLMKAKTYIGIDEDDDEAVVLQLAKDAGTPIESSETAWCAIFVNAILAQCGLETTGTMRARDFSDYGQKCEERVGAIVVYRSHVGFVPEIGKVLGGNQSDGCNIGEQRWYGKPIAYRFPNGYSV